MSHASSSKTCKYDVFLSFRGEDTRRNFVSHLYNALKQRGIHAFKDDERLETGKSISAELLKAIEDARFAVVIFSKRYASSRWCLEELAHIVKCKNELEQIVLPVFYDVSPSDVRHQNPPFAESFSKHEEKCKDDMDNVQRWRDAFAEAGKISGYHLQNFKDEADCIKKLVDHIFPKLLQGISPFPENLVGMESQVEKVTSLLDMESNDVLTIGIWGMGGIGKTEIASVLSQRYRDRFEADCFLRDVGTLYQKNGLTWLAQMVICKLLGEKMTLTSEHEGVIILKNRLRWKKVLLILDDVNHREQLEFLVGGPEWFGMGSRIILTARDKHLLISHVGDNVYEVQLLSEDEALELFSRHAFREKSPKKDFVELSRQVVKHAGGLPLALKVLGSSFYKRDKEQWRDIIDRLKRIPHNDILGKLRLSFDGLDKDDKKLFLDLAFLDIACLTRYDCQLYMKQVRECRGFQQLGINQLIEKSLISVNINTQDVFLDMLQDMVRDMSRDKRRDIEKDINNGIVMHNMIRDMGINVIREEYANSRIWEPEKVHDLFKGKLITENVECLCITKDCYFENDPVNYNNIFKTMQSLQLLMISEEAFGWDCAITYIPSSLRFIEWEGYPSSSLPESFELSQLIVLRLYKSRLVELWPISKKLSKLKHLDLSCSYRLTKTPNFGDTPNLETLNLQRCYCLEEVHPSLGHCRKLTNLNLTGCTKLKKLPKFVSMESLETLKLLECTSLEEYPDICGDMWRLSRLEVGSPWIGRLPPSLSGLSHLVLKDCKVLESIPDTIRNLTKLDILFCDKLATLPNSLFESEKLEQVNIRHCSKLVELFKSLGVQKKLPSSIPMESLVELYISNCLKLDTFPEIIGDMHCLERLTLESIGIRELLLSIGNLSNLKWLSVKSCEDLVSLPNSLCNLMNLQYLYLYRCKKLEKLPENIGDLQELMVLDARETAIFQLPPSITKLEKLWDLRFSHVLQHVQDSSTSVFCQLSASSYLNHVHLSNLNILGGLPEDLGSLQSLGHLDVSGSNISCLPKSIKELLHLQNLNVQFCQNLNELPGELPPNLMELFADYHLALKSIKNLVIKNLKLSSLSISWCGHEKSEYGNVSTCQVNVLKSLQYLIRTCIQGDFHQRDNFLISFPEVRMSELFDYQFINQKEMSIDLKPSWYTDKFKGFSICCYRNSKLGTLVATLVCKSDPEREHSLKYDDDFWFESPDMCFIYIPFETLWHASDNKKEKNPNDYYLFEVSTEDSREANWGVRLEYEKKDRRRRRKQRATQSPKLFPVPRKYTAVTTESGCSMVLEQPEPSLPSRKMDDAKRKRKRKRNRKKKRKIAGTDETSCSHCTN